MKTRLTNRLRTFTIGILLTLLCAASVFGQSTPTNAPTVLFNIGDFTSNPQAVRFFALYPVGVDNTNQFWLISRDRIARYTTATGQIIISNVWAGSYRSEMLGTSITTTNFFNFPATNGFIDARYYMAVPTNQTPAASTVAYTQSQSDGRFVHNTDFASETATGIITTNAFTAGERTVENRGTIWRVPWFGCDLFPAFGSSSTETDYWNAAICFYTNKLTATYNTITIDDGWQGPRDGNGNITASATKFPHGIPFTMNVLHTNGCFGGLYTEPHALTLAGGTGTLPQYMTQDASNFIAWGVDFMRMDYPENFPNPGHNARLSYFAGKFSEALEAAAGHPVPLYDSAWFHIGGEPILAPGSCNAWTISDNGDLITSGFSSPGPYWTNILQHWYYEMGINSQTGPAHWQVFDFLSPVGGYGMPSLWAIAPSPIVMQRAFGPTDGGNFGSPPPFTIITNKFWIAIVRDELGLPGQMISSNANGSVWYRILANNKRAVAVVNNTTNANVTMGFSSTDIAYPPGASFNALDVWYFTNNFCQATNFTTVPPNAAALFLVQDSDSTTSIGAIPGQVLAATGSNAVYSSGPLTITNRVWVVPAADWDLDNNFTRLSQSAASPANYNMLSGASCPGNVQSDFNIAIPEWVTNISGQVWVQCTTTQAWTNIFDTFYYSMDPTKGRIDTGIFPQTTTFGTNGLNLITFNNVSVAATNTAKLFRVYLGASTNSSTRYVQGSLTLILN